MKSILFFALTAMSLFSLAQTPVYDDLNIDSDELEQTYRAAGKNYIFLRSKRGSGGLNKTSSADSVKTFGIKEIILVFTEVNESAFDEREDANKERWENLLKTYPEYFHSYTTYKSVCQCKIGGDSVSFKKAQGFYVYFTPKDQPKQIRTEEPKSEVKNEIKKTEEKVADHKKTETKTETKKTEEKVTENKKEEPSKNTEKEVVKSETKKEKEIEKTEPEPAVTDESGSSTELKESDFVQKKSGSSKPKRAKDKKACRPSCYMNGTDDLNIFLKENISLTKKQKKHGKNLNAFLKLSLNFDGSIKKASVSGVDVDFNKQVTDAAKQMNLWTPAVRNGVTIKSEVKITLKYHKGAKAIVAEEVSCIPRPGPKCLLCMTDAEIGID